MADVPVDIPPKSKGRDAQSDPAFDLKLCAEGTSN